LAANTVNGSGNGARSGAQTLVLLAVPLNSAILQLLAEGPRQQTELRRETGSPPQTTLRAQLKRLVEIGAIEKRRRNRFPGTLDYELTEAGRDLVPVIHALEGWLDEMPDGTSSLGGMAAKAAIKALAEGWSTTMLRALAAGPISLTELDGVISSLSYPSLERRLSAMRLAGQVRACPGNGRTTRYAVTGRLRRGVGPLIAAARWERQHLPQATPPLGRLDVEAAFLLAVPLLELPAALSGVCRMAVEITSGARQHLAGVTIEVRSGEVVSCVTQIEVGADAWAQGSPSAWLDALMQGDSGRLERGGNSALTRTAVEGLRGALFGFASGKSI
jgi:DNA-binding HxlR family transcriptional regulator